MDLIALMQAVAKKESIWPRSVAGWISLVSGILVLSGMVGGILSYWLRQQLNGMGLRLKAVEDKGIKNETDIADGKSKQQAFEFQIADSNRVLGEIRGLMRGIKMELKKSNRRHEIDAREWAQRITRVETRLNDGEMK